MGEWNTVRNITEAAQELNISRRTLYNRIEELEIKTTKEGKNSYISDEDFNKLKERVNREITVDSTHVQEHVPTRDEHVNIHERMKNILAKDHMEGYVSKKDYEELKSKLEALEIEIKKSYQDRIESLENQLKEKDKQLTASSDEIKGLIMSVKSSIEQLPIATAEKEALISLDTTYQEQATTITEERKTSFWDKFKRKK